MRQVKSDTPDGDAILARIEGAISEGQPVMASDAKYLLQVALHHIEKTMRQEHRDKLGRGLDAHMKYEVCATCRHYRSQCEAGSILRG